MGYSEIMVEFYNRQRR